MPLASDVDFVPTNHFSLDSDFVVKSSTTAESEETIKQESSDGKTVLAYHDFNPITRYTAEYEYRGSNLATDLEAKLAQVVNDIWIDQIVITLAHKQAAKIRIEGHNHAANAHAAAGSGEFDGFALALSTYIGSSQGPTGLASGGKPWANANADATQTGLTLTYRCEHVDVEDHAGDHFAGDSFVGEVEARAEFIGTPTLTTTGWEMTSTELSEASKQADTYSAVGVKALTVTTAP